MITKCMRLCVSKNVTCPDISVPHLFPIISILMGDNIDYIQRHSLSPSRDCKACMSFFKWLLSAPCEYAGVHSFKVCISSMHTLPLQDLMLICDCESDPCFYADGSHSGLRMTCIQLWCGCRRLKLPHVCRFN